MPDTQDQKTPLSLMRRIMAGLGILIMVLSGGCSVFFMIGLGTPQDVGLVLLVGGVPFFVGFLVFAGATR